MYRVAEFERRGNRQQFTGFGSKGYFLSAKGDLYDEGVKMNLSDKRKNLYREINLFSGRKDNKGLKLYDKDLVFNRSANQYGIIRFLPTKGAFVMTIKKGKIEIPYTYLDCYEVSLVKVGTLYENDTKFIYKKY